ncbi:MAG: hypothetical protein RI932_1256 [Pseudomonadota bacterium]|jgi:transcriptional regulator with XRE-family HTH domain
MITKKGTPVIPALAHLEALTGGALTIAKLLRTLRENDGATQEEFARVLGISKQHLCDIEKGRKTVLATRAAQFALSLGQPPAFFIQIALEEEFRKSGLKLRIKVEAA